MQGFYCLQKLYNDLCCDIIGVDFSNIYDNGGEDVSWTIIVF